MKKERNWGIDLLRIVSMMMIVMLHTLGHGGLLDNSPKLSTNYEVIWGLEVLAYCSVNIFAIISGYVGVNNRFNYANILNLWILAMFYTVVNSIIGTMMYPDFFKLNDVLLSFFPILTQRYWYFTAYFCMSFFIPAFNYLLLNLPKKQMATIILSSLLLFSVMTTFISDDLFIINFGYSPLWLSILYLIGGYIKRYDFLAKWSKAKLFTLYLGASVITFATKFIIEWWAISHQVKMGNSWLLVRYTSPTMVIAAVALLILFAQIKPGKLIPIIKFLTPMCFSVYLIHVHPVWFKWIDHRFAYFLSENAFILISKTIGIVFMIYIICSLVDYLRLKLFELLKVKSISLKLSSLFASRYNDFLDKML